MKRKISGWGCYAPIEAEVIEPRNRDACRQLLLEKWSNNGKFIARGLGRSYGDSSVAECVLGTERLHHFHAFDDRTGVLSCEAGVSLADILNVFVPRGWFLPVTPGTKFVTVGGAIAADVHGKNHHKEGTFGRYVRSLDLMLGSGEVVRCSPVERADLFDATRGGMGLTGVILSASIQLRRIVSSNVMQRTLKARALDELLDLFELHRQATYSVAWIDCSVTGKRLGRSLLMLGEHAQDGDLAAAADKRQVLPLSLLSAGLNKYSIRAFNFLYYHRALRLETRHVGPYEPYFYPLDKLHNWNRLYGKNGFLQYQFVLPAEAGRKGLQEILRRIAASGRGSFLAVLKLLGTASGCPLSFPLEGYTLALDFKSAPGVLELLQDLDRGVLEVGGRLYLAKDARMSEATFKKSYPAWERFEEVRERHAGHRFASRQSRRIGLV